MYLSLYNPHTPSQPRCPQGLPAETTPNRLVYSSSLTSLPPGPNHESLHRSRTSSGFPAGGGRYASCAPWPTWVCGVRAGVGSGAGSEAGITFTTFCLQGSAVLAEQLHSSNSAWSCFVSSMTSWSSTPSSSFKIFGAALAAITAASNWPRSMFNSHVPSSFTRGSPPSCREGFLRFHLLTRQNELREARISVEAIQSEDSSGGGPIEQEDDDILLSFFAARSLLSGCKLAMYTTTVVFTANYDMNQNGCGRTIPMVMTTTMIIATVVVIVMMIVMVIG